MGTVVALPDRTAEGRLSPHGPLVAACYTLSVSQVTHLECTKCGAHSSAGLPQNVCPKDGGILYARYDLQSLKQNFKPETLRGREASLWRYREVLPVDEDENISCSLSCPSIPSFRGASRRWSIDHEQLVGSVARSPDCV